MLGQQSPNLPNPASAGVFDQPDWTADEKAIRRACDRLARAWSAGDVSGFVAGWAPDCDHITLTRVRRVRKGKLAVEIGCRETFARRERGPAHQMSFGNLSIRFLKPDVALVDGNIDYTGSPQAEAQHDSPMTEPFTAVMIRQGEEWLITASRTGPTMPARKVVRIPSE